ncbi:MAG TPA: flagellar biosynthetic protein FliR [Planctomycetota bacterium]|jgi:flagellar biosynthetic protein FliR|nr:flagellar biosynthetic protein FliR [Planctomycetota bacterium]
MEQILQSVAADGPVFLLVFFRIAGVLALAPVFGSAIAPAPVKIFLSLLLAVLFFPLVRTTGAPVALEGGVLFLAVLWELAVGLLIGFASALLFAGVQFGGHLIDQELGILQANLLDPMLSEQISIVGQFKVLLATAVYLLINGHHLLIAAVADSFRAVPLLGLTFSQGVALHVSDTLMRDVFRMGIEIAGPALVTLFLVSVALAFMARTAPEMNIFALSFPLRLAVGLVVVALGVGLFVAGFENRAIRQSGALQTLVGMLGG